VVRICDTTLKKRLNEFDETQASEMTVPEFNALFKMGSVSEFVGTSAEKRDKSSFEQQNWAHTSSRRPPSLKQQEKKKKQAELASDQQHEGDEGLQQLSNEASKVLAASKALRELDEDHQIGAENSAGHAKLMMAKAAATTMAADSPKCNASKGQASVIIPEKRRVQGVRGNGQWCGDGGDSGDEDMVIEAQREEEEAVEEAAANEREENERLSDVDDAEIEDILCNVEEAGARETAWTELNRDYIEKQLEKEREQLARSGEERQPKRKRRAIDNSVSGSAHEAASKMLRNRNLSNKVNYEALEELLGAD